MVKNSTKSIIENDIILVYIENNPAFFARIEKIYPDTKKGWWRVELLILQIPLMVTTWILDNDQVRGDDFTMGGTPVRIEKVVAPAMPTKIESTDEKERPRVEKNKKQARIISLNPGD